MQSPLDVATRSGQTGVVFVIAVFPRPIRLLIVSLTLGSLAIASPCFAVKVRKKPPLQPLPPPMVVGENDAAAAVDPTDSTSPQQGKPATAATTSSGPKSGTAAASAIPANPPARVPYPDGALVCLYGSVRDAKTGKIKCLSPEQLSPPVWVRVNTRPLAEKLGMLANSPGIPMPTGASEQGVDPAQLPGDDTQSDEDGPARVVRVSFENGSVGGALRNVKAKRDEIGACVLDNGGLRAPTARLKFLFFVGKSQKPTGMIVASAKNVPTQVVRCVRRVLEKTTIGRPSTDAVGVTLLIELRDDTRK